MSLIAVLVFLVALSILPSLLTPCGFRRSGLRLLHRVPSSLPSARVHRER